VLLLSTDPAHSLGDALETPLDDRESAVPGAPPNLRARELDAPAAFARQRDAYRESVDALFDRLRGRSRFDPAYDRAVVRDLIDLAPPGLDELFAILSVIETLFEKKTHDLVVVDTAPTGHALRLLRLPAGAHRWVKELLKVLLKYREVIPPGELGADLVALSKGLRRLQEALADPAQARFVAVTRPEELPIAETTRLASSLREMGICLHALVVNSVTPPGCPRCRRISASERARLPALERICTGKSRCAMFLAPAVAPPPRGPSRLAQWGVRWESA
jgi:arsenite-transporting ATPase